MSLLEIKNLQITFGGLDALSNLDFAIEEGEIVSVIGPNGAGKTTFFNAISGMISPTSGEIIFDGESVLGLDPNQITEMGITNISKCKTLSKYDSFRECNGFPAL